MESGIGMAAGNSLSPPRNVGKALAKSCDLLPFAEVEVPYTCGELVQGALDGEPFLVSCPIDLRNSVRVTLDSPTPCREPDSKAARAVSKTLRAIGQPDRPYALSTSCALPPSRGFGTSTADVVGAIAATAAAAGARLGPGEIAKLAVSIEPTDGTVFPGLALFSHRTAKGVELLGPAPALPIVVLEFEGAVDTLDYNAHLDLDYLIGRQPEYAAIMELLRRGLWEGNYRLIGRAATLSARLSQHLLTKPELETTIELAEDGGAVGVCAAHSGTALGVLFPPESIQPAQRLMATCRDRLGGLERVWLTRMVDGGARIVKAKGGFLR